MPCQNCFLYTESIALWESWKIGSKVANCDNGVGVSIKIWIFLYVFPFFYKGDWSRTCQDDEEDFGTGKFAKYQKMMWDLIEKPDTRWFFIMMAITFERQNRSVKMTKVFFLLHPQQLLVWNCQQCNFMLEHNLPPSLCYY